MKRWILVMAITLACLLTVVSAFAYDDNTAGVENVPEEVRTILTTKWPEWEITGWVNPAGRRSSSACAFAAIHKDRSNTLVAFGYKDSHWVYKWNNAGALPQRTYGMQLLEGTEGGESQARFIIRELTSPTTETVWVQSRSGQPFLLTSYIVHDTDSSIILETLTINAESIRYQGWRTEDRTVSYRGTTQRDLRYFSWSAFPKTPDELRTGLTAAPEIPSGDLEALDIKFTGGKRYDVFSAPDRTSLRGGNGKARVSTNGWIQVFGRDNGFILVQYSIDSSHYRFGYIDESSLPKSAVVPELNFSAVAAWTISDVSITDDPLYSQSVLLRLPSDAQVTWLATMGNWAYVESSTGDWVRGFVPLSSLRMNHVFDLGNIPMGNTPFLEGSLSVDYTGRIVSVHFRPVSEGPLDDMTIAGFDLTDPYHHLVFASLTAADQDGFFSATFAIPEDTTAIQIQALPEYGSIVELNNLPSISVEW